MRKVLTAEAVWIIKKENYKRRMNFLKLVYKWKSCLKNYFFYTKLVGTYQLLSIFWIVQIFYNIPSVIPFKHEWKKN